MKDKTSIFKHSGAGTGFYGGIDRHGTYLSGEDYKSCEQDLDLDR